MMKFALLLSGLLLVACHNQTTTIPRSHNLLAQGIDLPTDASNGLNDIRDSKLEFVARYYRSPTSRWPTLTAIEAQRLSALGVKIVAVWEWHSHDPAYFSHTSGYSDAISAYSQAKSVGQPAGSAIYFAVDYNATSTDISGAIDQYFRGIAAGLAAAGNGRSEYKVGVYGSGAVCEAMRRAGLAQYAWLTNSTSWAGTLNYDDWNIRQGGHFSVLSFDHDADEAKDDYGGFRVATADAAPIAPEIATVAASATDAPPFASSAAEVVAPAVYVTTQIAAPDAITYGASGQGEPAR